jgi:hypothetical protein
MIERFAIDTSAAIDICAPLGRYHRGYWKVITSFCRFPQPVS